MIANVALSNMPHSKLSKVQGDRTIIKFENTPSMSTYILSWVIGPMKSIEYEKHYPKLRVWATEDRYRSGEFALAVASDLMKYLGNYFDFQFDEMLPKYS